MSAEDSTARCCWKCKKTKPLDCFEKDSRKPLGRSNRCKSCKNAYVRKWASRAEQRRKITNRRRLHRDKFAKYSRDYARRHPRRVKLATLKWIKNNPEKRRAVVALNNAVRDGRIKKRPCGVCGSTDRVNGHHEDYSMPLRVTWLCHFHHMMLKHSRAKMEA